MESNTKEHVPKFEEIYIKEEICDDVEAVSPAASEVIDQNDFSKNNSNTDMCGSGRGGAVTSPESNISEKGNFTDEDTSADAAASPEDNESITEDIPENSGRVSPQQQLVHPVLTEKDLPMPPMGLQNAFGYYKFSWNKQVTDPAVAQHEHISSHRSSTTDEDKRFQCFVCNKRFKTNTKLARHMLTHTGEKPFKCETCGKHFNQKSTLLNHEMLHTKELPYSCNRCPKSFARRTILLSHLRTHTREKPFHCNVCSKRFTQKVHLQTHQRTHTGEKPFSCDICNRTFTQKSILVSHYRTHTGEKPFACTMCDRKFTRKWNLTNHQKCHTE